MSYDPIFYEITDWHYSTHQLKKALRLELKELGEQIEELKDYELSSESESEFRDENSGWNKKFDRKRGLNMQKQLQDVLKSKNLVEENLFKLQVVNHVENDTLKYKKNDTNINNELSQISNDSSCDLEPQFKKGICSLKEEDVDSTNQLEDNNLEKQKTLTLSEQSILKEIHLNFKAKSSKISNIIVLQQQDIDELLKDKNLAQQQQEILQQKLTRYKVFEDNLIYQIYLFEKLEKRIILINRYRKQRKIRVEVEGLIKIKKDLQQKIGKIKPALIIVLKSLLMDKLIEDTF